MLTVFNLQWLRLRREPVLVLTFFIITLGFVFFILGTGGQQTLTVQTFSDTLSDTQMETWLNRLNDSDAYNFEIQTKATIEERIRMIRITFALELDGEGYGFLVGQASQFLRAVDQYVGRIYRTRLQIQEINRQFPDGEVVQQDFLAFQELECG